MHASPSARVATDDNHIVVGWAPLAALADAIEPFSRDDAALLRSAPGSDVRDWTVLHVGINTLTLTRVARDELLSIDTEEAEHPIEPIDEAAIDPDALAADGPLRFPALTGPCEWNNGGDHEGGVPYVELFDDGQLSVVAVTCTKCWQNAVPREPFVPHSVDERAEEFPDA